MTTQNMTTQPCSICYKVLEPEQQIYQPCQYLSCSDCLAEWTIVKITERQCASEETIPCMAGCGDFFPIQSALQGLSVHERARIDEALFQVYLNRQPDVRKCPKKSCPYAGVACITPGCTDPLACELCETQWKDKEHASNYENLSDIIQRFMVKKNEFCSALWKRLWAKKCPKCGMMIEKDGGCDHMTCKKCKFEFCWNCSVQHPRHNDWIHKGIFLLKVVKALVVITALLAALYFAFQILCVIPFFGTLMNYIVIPFVIAIFRGVCWLFFTLWKFVLTNLMIIAGNAYVKIPEKQNKIVSLVGVTVCFVLLLCFGGFSSMIKICLMELTIYLTAAFGKYLYKKVKIFIRDSDIQWNPKLLSRSMNQGIMLIQYGQDSIAHNNRSRSLV